MEPAMVSAMTEAAMATSKIVKPADRRRDEESRAVDGVLFADTDYGDAFVFDVSQKSPAGDYPVYWFNHEFATFEPFASNFAECVKRFAKRN